MHIAIKPNHATKDCIKPDIYLGWLNDGSETSQCTILSDPGNTAWHVAQQEIIAMIERPIHDNLKLDAKMNKE